MIATSDSTALAAISSDARIGRSTDDERAARPASARRARGPSSRPKHDEDQRPECRRVPITPSGSRTKILISSQVSLQSPRSMVSSASVANRVAGELEEDVLERRQLGAEVGHADPMLAPGTGSRASPGRRRGRES